MLALFVIVFNNIAILSMANIRDKNSNIVVCVYLSKNGTTFAANFANNGSCH
jgi:hypothetical protein